MSKSRWIGLAIGIVLGLAATYFSVLAAGGGHGTYLPAHLLFPGPMLLARLSSGVTPAVIAACLAQFPIYGAAIGHDRRWALVVLAVHVGGAALALALRKDMFIP